MNKKLNIMMMTTTIMMMMTKPTKMTVMVKMLQKQKTYFQL